MSLLGWLYVTTLVLFVLNTLNSIATALWVIGQVLKDIKRDKK